MYTTRSTFLGYMYISSQTIYLQVQHVHICTCTYACTNTVLYSWKNFCQENVFANFATTHVIVVNLH